MKSIAIVGATGLVGLEMKKLLPEFFAAGTYKTFLFASKERPTEGVLELGANKKILDQCDAVLNASSAEVALTLRAGLQAHQVLIDNSSALRLDPAIPLVVPEVNGECLKKNPRLIANPNCTAILLTVSLAPLKKFGIERVIVSTYQAASGAGIKGLEELELQIQAAGNSRPMPQPQVFPAVLLGNVLSHNTPIHPEGESLAGYNDEEAKVIEESRKILGLPELKISTTCIRVPVKRSHTESVSVDLRSPLSLAELRETYSRAPGIKVTDDWSKNHFPMPLETQNQDLVFVGRLRQDPFLSQTVHYMISGDQLRKGAATNALQILRDLWNV